MKSLSLFFLLFSFFSYGQGAPLYWEEIKKKSEGYTLSSSRLSLMREELQKDMQVLIMTLAKHSTSEEDKMEIIEILSKTAVLNNQITEVLQALVSERKKCEIKKEQEGCFVEDTLGIRAQAELVRRRIKLLIREEYESWDMVLDGVLGITGGLLFFVPVGGPFLSTALLTVRFATVGKGLAGAIE